MYKLTGGSQYIERVGANNLTTRFVLGYKLTRKRETGGLEAGLQRFSRKWLTSPGT